MCMLKFEVLFDVFKFLYCLLCGKNFFFCCFFKWCYGVDRMFCFDVSFIYVFYCYYLRIFCWFNVLSLEYGM